MQNRLLSLPTLKASEVNVGQTERLLSALAGGALAVYGLRRSDAPGIMMAIAGASLLYRGGTGHCHAYQAAGVNTAEDGPSEAVRVEHVITINRPADQLYAFWRDLENLPTILRNVEAVAVLDTWRSLWRVKGPLGRTVEWEAYLEKDEPNQLIAWRSVPDAEILHAGSVRFTPAPGNRGTEVRVSMHYHPPAGKFGDFAAKLAGSSPEQEIREDLRRFKQFMETGEIPTTDGQPAGHEVSMFDAMSGRKG